MVRLYQVEYAIETVRRGTIAVGIKTKDGIIIAVEEKPRKLQISQTAQKIFQIDDHVGVAAAGYIPDARSQVDNARFFSQSNKLIYDETVDVETIAKHSSGTYISYDAVAIGSGSDQVTEFLEKNYKPDISLDDAGALAAASIYIASEDKEGSQHILMSQVLSDTKTFEIISEEQIKKYSNVASEKYPSDKS
jgi:proteasome alpha subunit